MVTLVSHQGNTRKLFTLFVFSLALIFSQVSGQESDSYFYRVYFLDKQMPESGYPALSGLFSPRAVERRQKASVTSVDYSDIPVSSSYIDQISSLGFTLHCRSRWMNTALFKTRTPADLSLLSSLPFVKEVKVVKEPGAKNKSTDKLLFEVFQEERPPFDRPVTMLNGKSIHESGFNGRGIGIAVLDAGFSDAESISSLQPLRSRNGIIGTYDFVRGSDFVFDYQTHGTAVLSVLSGDMPGFIEGTAQGADYWLLVTEDDRSEYPVEEDYWVAGAEFADSSGADIISTSLGYFTFDNPQMNYKYSDLDGNTTFITRAADIAAAKGILVVCSAGNERTGSWIHIIAPSDGDSVLSIGAVDGNRNIAPFSSSGPSYDGRVKPDIVAQGVSVPVQTMNPVSARANGTSFSCPVISGMCACVLEAVPQACSFDILPGIRAVADRYNTPDSLYGYGIPDMQALIHDLQEKLVIKPVNAPVISPNPFSDELTVTFRDAPEYLIVEVFNTSGMVILKRNYSNYVSRSLVLDELGTKSQGIYFIRLTTQDGTTMHKAIRVTR